MSFYQPKYITLQSVKRDLDGKVQFSNDNPKYVSDNDVLNNIQSGEAWVERILSRQYVVSPQLTGVDINGNDIPFNQITPTSTIYDIQKLCLLKTCIFLMETEFGKGEGVRGQSYRDNYIERLNNLEHEIIGIDQISGQYLYPPLPGLKLDPQSSFYQKGIPFPRVSVMGSRPVSQIGRLNQRAVQGQVNPFRNWFFNNLGRRGNCR